MTVDNIENDQVILATGGYDHTLKLWQTHTGICNRTMQHVESVSRITYPIEGSHYIEVVLKHCQTP